MWSTVTSWIVGCVIALAHAACGNEDRYASGPHEQAPDGKWAKLPTPSISGRNEALVIAVGDEIIVAGGWSFLCPPGADCVLPSTPPYADGAAYSRTTRQWKQIADAPVGFRSATSAVVDDDVYVLIQCDQEPTCPSGRTLLRYRSATDAWDSLPGPDSEGQHRLVGVAGGFVAYSMSDEGVGRMSPSNPVPDFQFVADEDRWQALPADPLPPMYDRFVVEYDGRYLLFGTPLDSDRETKLGAAYDPETDEWQEIAESHTQGYQVWRAGSRLYLNPHFGSGGGGIYDPVENAWRPLPNPPDHDMAGVIGDDGASYEYASGWVLDTRTGDWLSIEPRPNSSQVSDEVVAAGADGSLIVFGGQSWETGDGLLLNDTWTWTPPYVTM